MAVTINAKGTSVPYFTIGKAGVTVYQGTADPSQTYSINHGDYWLDSENNSLKVWATSAWAAPQLADLTFVNSTISTEDDDIVLQTNGANAKVIFAGDTGPGIITASEGQDLYIDPSLGGGGNLILNDNQWPAADGTAGQVLSTNGAGILSFVDAGSTPGGESVLELYTENPISQVPPVATGNNAIALGTNSTASGTGSLSHGDGATATLYGHRAFSSGSFATNGDAQHGMYILRALTTDNTVTEMFLDGPGGSQILLIPDNSVVTFSILVSARRTDDIDGGAGYKFEGVVMKDDTVDSICFIGSPSKTALGKTDSPWDVSVTANDTTGYLQFMVTGEAGKIIRWIATVSTAEITN